MSSNPYLALVAKLETAGGRKTIKGPAGEDSFNLFNIKQFNKEAPGFVAHDKAEGSRDRYRVYASTEESEADMLALLQRRYPEAHAAMQQPYGDESVAAFAHGLKRRGYATDPNYVEKLVKLSRSIPPSVSNPVQQAVAQVVEAGAGRLAPLKSAAAARVLRPEIGMEQQKLRVEAEPTTWEQFGGAVAGATDMRLITGVRELLNGTSEQFPAEQGFVIPKELTLDVDSGRLAERREARSKAELDYIMAREEEQDFRAKTVFSDGMVKGLVLSFAAEATSVSNWVAPFAASRSLGMQAARLAAEGKAGAAVVRSVGEALVAGTGLELAAQALEQRFDPANLAIAATADIAFGAGFGYAAVRASQAQRVFTEAAGREAALFERAATNAGPGAKPEQIELEYQRLRTQEIREPMAAGLAPTPNSTKLMDSPDEAVDDEVVDDGDLFKAEGQPAADAPQAAQVLDFKPDGKVLVAEFPNGQGGKGYIELGEIDGRMFPAMVDNGLPPGQSSGRIVKAYEDAIAFAWRLGKQFTSDDSVTAGAARVYEALGKRGYIVEKNPNARLATKPEVLTERWVTDDGAPVYTVGAKQTTRQDELVGDTLLAQPAPKVGDELSGPEVLKEQPLAVEDIKPPVTVRQAMADALESPALKVVTETSRATRHLITHLQSIVPDRVQDSVMIDFMGGIRGAYNTGRNDISAPGASSTSLSPEGWAGRNDANVLAHEIVHSATGRLIAAVRDRVPGVSQGSVEAIQRLEGIRLELDAHLKATGLRKPGRQAGADYAAGDLDEFVAQVMSDVETRKALAEMPAKGFKDMLSKFADAVVRLLGLDPKTNNSALKEAVGLIEKIIKEGEVPTGTSAATWIKTKPGLQAPVQNTRTEFGALEEAKASVNAFSTDPIAVKYGLTGLPVATSAERAKAKAILNLWKKADDFDKKYPLDAEWVARADNLVDNSVFSAASTGLLMLKSKNPVARMIASELLEDASGVQARRHSTAAISKYLHERLFMGNTINDVQNAYSVWRNKVGGSLKDDYFGGGEIRAKFDREIAQEIESRRVSGASLTTDPSIKAAADSLEKAYERIRKAQIDNKTLGWAALPGTSVGYMPHKISPSKWRQLSNEQRQVVHDALTEQFVNIEGWDITFSDQLASRYLQRVQARAVGGHDAPIGGASAGSAEIIEDALRIMDMSADEIRKNMQRFNRGAAGWTKGRLNLDLNRVYDVNGQSFKLLDVFDTDQLSLLRSQAGRASGEVALARKGVYGRPGLELIREAMTYGESGARALDTEVQAFRQVAAEFINAPFGTEGPKWLERARILNSVVRLGGIVFNQFAEFINAVTHVGVARTLSAVGAMPRLRSEIKALAAGKAVDNPLLTSIEKLGGAEFGTDSYKIIMPFDSPDMAYPIYGMDTVGVADRLLRGASYAQSKLSLWRAMHSVQQRGMAEQIVAKIARYSRDNTEDVALTQFGITPEMRRAIIADGAARWDGDSLVEFDVTKIKDADMAEQIIQSVHRGVQQIIQGTFIGETGKWAHDGYLKVLTQFRTFSLTAMEKQWARQRNSRGTAQALGILLGSMSVAVPVYVARVYATSVGRPDQEEYIEKRLTPELIARQTLNYVALSGLAGDFLDIGAALAPDEYGVRMTGGRAGTDTDFVGNLVAPSMSLVDDVWKGFQNLDDPEKLARVLPGSRIPYLLPAINSLGEE